jgi:hypothetical protein
MGWDWVHLVLLPLFGQLYQFQMIGDDCGAIGGMRISRGNRSTRRKPAPAPLCPPQIPHKLTWARTRAAAVGRRRLTAWATVRPNINVTLHREAALDGAWEIFRVRHVFISCTVRSGETSRYHNVPVCVPLRLSPARCKGFQERVSNFSIYCAGCGQASSKQAYCIRTGINMFFRVSGLQRSRSIPELVVETRLFDKNTYSVTAFVCLSAGRGEEHAPLCMPYVSYRMYAAHYDPKQLLPTQRTSASCFNGSLGSLFNPAPQFW